ncbi:MAG: nitroreductase family protein [Spirochaetales bacterium]
MAQIIEEIQARRARRALDWNKAIDPETIDRMIEAAHLSASCSNKQPWRYLIADSDPVRERLQGCLLGGNYWARHAPLLIGVATRNSDDCQLSEKREYALFDTGMATAHLILQATREGLYAHPMAGFDATKMKEEFSLPEDVIPVTIVAIGYPGSTEHLNEKHLQSEHSERSRVPVSEVASRERFMYDQ